MPAIEVSSSDPITNGTPNGDAGDLADVMLGGGHVERPSEVCSCCSPRCSNIKPKISRHFQQSQNVLNLLGDPTSPMTSTMPMTSSTKEDSKPSNILNLLIDLDLSAPSGSESRSVKRLSQD